MGAFRRRGRSCLIAKEQVRLREQRTSHGNEFEACIQTLLNRRCIGDATKKNERHGEGFSKLTRHWHEVRLFIGVVRHEVAADNLEAEFQWLRKGSGELLAGSLTSKEIHRIVE